jgi:hypothetical protein
MAEALSEMQNATDWTEAQATGRVEPAAVGACPQLRLLPVLLLRSAGGCVLGMRELCPRASISWCAEQPRLPLLLLLPPLWPRMLRLVCLLTGRRRGV